MIFWSRRTSNINETGHETWKGNLKKKLPLGQKYISKFTHASSPLGSSPSTIWQWSWASISNPQMETNAGGLREGEGGKAGALLLPAAQVSNSIIVVIINYQQHHHHYHHHHHHRRPGEQHHREDVVTNAFFMVIIILPAHARDNIVIVIIKTLLPS